MCARSFRIGWLAALMVLGAAFVAAAPRVQPRAHPARVAVAAAALRVMDGDTAEIHWSPADVETVRVLGIDTAELFGSRRRRAGARDPGEMSPHGAEARGFARGAFAAARRIELERAARLDRYGRTLGYFFLDGRNYSVLVLEVGLARETVSRFGDNGFPAEARAVLEAAGRADRSRSRGPRPRD